MGVEALIGGLFGLGSAAISASSARSVAASNAAAQADINEETMKFNREEAAKARNWQHQEGVLERDFNKAEAELAREFNAEQILAARNYETRMANTAHQREVVDLKAAGLNPILSATGGNGAASPVAPILSASPASSGSIPMGSTASVSGLQAPKKENYMGAFVNTAMEGLRLDNDIKRAKADELNAKASWENAQTNTKRQAQDALESMERITKIKSDTELNAIRKRGEEAQAKLYEEKIISEIRERLDKHNLSEAMQYNARMCAQAAATAASAQAHMAAIQDKIQSAESPERIKKLQSEAYYYQSQFDKNKWIMEDPKIAAQRKWWKETPEAAHANEMLDIIGNVVHGSVGIHGGN